jgi:hypothetical protein
MLKNAEEQEFLNYTGVTSRWVLIFSKQEDILISLQITSQVKMTLALG